MSTEEAVVEAPKETHEFDKQRQQEQQDLANSRKRTETLEASSAVAQQEIADLKLALESAPKTEEGEVDAYEQVARTKETVKILEKGRAEDQARINRLEADQSRSNQKAEYSDLLKSLGAKYGEKHRNSAVEKVEELCRNAGYTLTGKDHPKLAEITIELEKAWIIESYEDKLKPSQTEKPKSDSGLGGLTFGLDDGITEGSMEDVLAAMKKQQDR